MILGDATLSGDQGRQLWELSTMMSPACVRRVRGVGRQYCCSLCDTLPYSF